MSGRNLWDGSGAAASPLAALVLVLCLAGAAPAQELTLADAYRLALANHDAMDVAREAVVQSEREIDRAFSRVLPTLSAEGSYTRYSEKKTVGGFLLQPESSTRFEVRLSQSLYDGGKEWSLLRQAEKRLSRDRLGVDEMREEILIETARAYYGVLAAGRNVEIKEAALRRARSHRDVAAARLEVGTATKAQLLRAEAEAADAAAELTRARLEFEDSMELLRRLTGLAGPVEAAEPPEQPPVVLPKEQLVEVALAKRLDMRRARMDEAIAAEGVEYAKGNFLPSVSIDGVYSRRDQSPQTSFLLNDVLYAGVTVRFPIFEGGLRRAELDQARSRLRAAESQRRDRAREVALQVRVAYNNLKAAAAVIESYEKKLAFARENYEMVFKQFAYGLADSVDVVDAEATLTEAETALMAARYERELRVLELKKSMGVLLDETGAEMARKE